MAPPRIWKRNFYAEANGTASGDQSIDNLVANRTEDDGLRQRIITAQERVQTALGNQRALYFLLEDLFGQRGERRDEAMFNVGFEHGYLLGRRDSLSAVWRRTPRGRSLATKVTALVVEVGMTQPNAMAVLLEIAWSLLTKTGQATAELAPAKKKSRTP
jgi:hypothetical protein